MAEAYTNRNFADIFLGFTPHPATKDLSKLRNQEAIRRSVRNIVLTNFYERHYDNAFGANISGLLFENIGAATTTTIRAQIEGAIKTYEQRVTVVGVSVQEQENGYHISVAFSYKNYPEKGDINLFLERVR